MDTLKRFTGKPKTTESKKVLKYRYYDENLEVSHDMYALITVLHSELHCISRSLSDLVSVCNRPEIDLSELDSIASSIDCLTRVLEEKD